MERERREKMKKMSTQKLVIAAVLSAIIVIMGYTPLGLIPLPTMTATILHIPVAIGAILYGPQMGLILGTVMGLTTLSKAILSPVGPLDPLFINPLVSVLPRALMGIITAYAFMALYKVVKKTSISIGISAAVASLSNTVLTLGALGIIYAKGIKEILQQNEIVASVLAFLVGIAATSGVGEIIVTVLIVLPITLALRKTINS